MISDSGVSVLAMSANVTSDIFFAAIKLPLNAGCDMWYCNDY